MSRHWGTLGGALLVLGLLSYLTVTGLGDNLVYFVTPTELSTQGEAAIGKPYRLAGAVQQGSVEWEPETLRLAFALVDDQESVVVVSTGAPPQMFHEGIAVVVEGQMSEEGVFEAHNLMVKHSNEYAPGDDPESPNVTQETTEP